MAKEIIILHFVSTLLLFITPAQKKKKKKVEVWFLKIRMESAGVEIYFFVLSLQVSF